MNDLWCCFVEFLRQECINVSNYQTCLLKAQMKEHFGDVLIFHCPQKCVVKEYASAIIFQLDFWWKNVTWQWQLLNMPQKKLHYGWYCLTTWTTPSPCCWSIQCCNVLEIWNHGFAKWNAFSTYPKRCFGEELQLAELPAQFSCWILAGNIGDQEQAMSYECVKLTSDADHRDVLSIGQELRHSVACGHVKTAKHVALPIAIKWMTRGTKAVMLLNHFGSSVFKTPVCEIEVAMAEWILAYQEHHTVCVPSNIIHNSFVVVFCWTTV